MSDLELVLTMLAEASTTELSKAKQPQTFTENKDVAFQGGNIAGNARRELEEKSGNPVITEKNAFDFTNLVDSIVESIDVTKDSEG